MFRDYGSAHPPAGCCRGSSLVLGYLVHGMGPVGGPITTAARGGLAHLDHWVFGLDTRPFAVAFSVCLLLGGGHGSAGSRVDRNAQYARHGPRWWTVPSGTWIATTAQDPPLVRTPRAAVRDPLSQARSRRAGEPKPTPPSLLHLSCGIASGTALAHRRPSTFRAHKERRCQGLRVRRIVGGAGTSSPSRRWKVGPSNSSKKNWVLGWICWAG